VAIASATTSSVATLSLRRNTTAAGGRVTAADDGIATTEAEGNMTAIGHEGPGPMRTSPQPPHTPEVPRSAGPFVPRCQPLARRRVNPVAEHASELLVRKGKCVPEAAERVRTCCVDETFGP